MSSAVDTLKIYERLKAANRDDKAAKELAEVFKEAETARLDEVATKQDIKALEAAVDLKLANINGEIKLLKWMMGAVLAGIISLILKAFFA